MHRTHRPPDSISARAARHDVPDFSIEYYKPNVCRVGQIIREYEACRQTEAPSTTIARIRKFLRGL